VDQELVVAAPLAVGEISADLRPCFIDRAAPRFGIEEAADRAEMLVGLVAQNARAVLVAPFGELLLRLGELQAEMPAKPLQVLIGDRNMRVGAAIGRAFQAVVVGLDWEPRFAFMRRQLFCAAQRVG
jgi:hypothetical protein